MISTVNTGKNCIGDPEAIKEGYFPKLGIGHVDAKIVLVFDRPGHNFQSNERGWKLEELNDDIKRYRKLNRQNHNVYNNLHISGSVSINTPQ